MNDEKQDEVQVAICPTGSKFFWCVVDSMSDEVLAQGRTDTLEEAEEQMWAQAAIHRNSRRRVQVDEDFARRIRRQLWKSDYRPIGKVLYEYFAGPDKPLTFLAHPIVKQTKKSVYVKCGRCVYKLKLERLLHNRRASSTTADRCFLTLPAEELWAAERADKRRWNKEDKRLRNIGLSAFSQQEIQNVKEMWQKWDEVFTDEDLLESCLIRRSNDFLDKTVHEIGT